MPVIRGKVLLLTFLVLCGFFFIPSFCDTLEQSAYNSPMNNSTSEGPVLLILPATISEPGIYHITQDWTIPNNSTPLTILSSDVIIDGGGHLINGTVFSENSVGVCIQGLETPVSNISLQNISVSGYQMGIDINETRMVTIDTSILHTNQISGLTIRNSSDVSISETILSENQGANGSVGGNGLNVILSENISVSRSQFLNNGFGGSGSGFVAVQSSFSLSDCVFSGNSASGIESKNAGTGSILRDLTVTGNGGSGISVTQSEGVQISGCRIEQNTQGGLDVSGSKNGFLVDNQVSENQVGISLFECEDFSLSGNILKSNKINLDVTGSSPSNYDHVIDRSNHADNRAVWYLNSPREVTIGPSDNPACIYIVNGSDIIISDLVLSHNGVGVFLIGSRNISLIQVAALDNAFGIRAGYGTSDISLVNCTAENNLIAGFATSLGSNISYRSCSAQNNLVGFVGSESSRLIYLGCSAERQDGLRKRGPSGYMISDCDHVQIINSSANKNGFDGIYVKNSSAVQISGTTLQTNAIAGLAVLSDGVTVVNSSISANKAGGILIYGNQSALIGNRISGNSGRGLIIDGSGNTRIWNNVFNNTKNVEVTKTSHSTIWNISPQEGVTITGSPYLGGNFWGNPNRSGFSDTCIPDSQGYCPAPYKPGGSDSDYYPLARYENIAAFSNTSVSSFSSGKITGDLNQNNRVEFDDVVTLMELITENQTSDLTWDLNSDKRINLQDVIVLFERLDTDS